MNKIDPKTLPEVFRSSVERLNAIVPELGSTASDRACVLVIASLLDNSLEALLETTFRVNPNVTDKDCDFLLRQRPMPPLGSASIRARLAFVMGLIDRLTLDAISYVLEIRNSFAHKPTPSPLTDEMAKKLRDKLPSFVQECFDEISLTNPLTDEHRARIQFVSGCAMLCVFLDGRCVDLQQNADKLIRI